MLFKFMDYYVAFFPNCRKNAFIKGPKQQYVQNMRQVSHMGGDEGVSSGPWLEFSNLSTKNTSLCIIASELILKAEPIQLPTHRLEIVSECIPIGKSTFIKHCSDSPVMPCWIMYFQNCFILPLMVVSV